MTAIRQRLAQSVQLAVVAGAQDRLLMAELVVREVGREQAIRAMVVPVRRDRVMQGATATSTRRAQVAEGAAVLATLQAQPMTDHAEDMAPHHQLLA